MTEQPGTQFRYNTPATFMQSAIVQKVSGQTVLDYLRPRLFEPLGIANPRWDTNSEGISLGGYGLRVRTEDIAKLGQLYLQRGMWNGRRLLPAEWVAQATSRQIGNGDDPNSDWAQGYGFQFWQCRHGAYRGDGAFGQILRGDAGTGNGGRDHQRGEEHAGVLNVLWDHLLPAAGPEPLAADPAMADKLRARLAALTVPPAQGRADIPDRRPNPRPALRLPRQ